jgi:hypothetical protein
VNATSLGGEVDALDPAGYGPITISQAITIEGQGWSYIAPPAGGNAITINAVSGNVAIHGVSLNGAGITGGTAGIVFNSGAGLTVTNCVVQNFVGNSIPSGSGIFLSPSSGTVSFVITNTMVRNNPVGIYYLSNSGSPNSNIVVEHVVATDNGYGLYFAGAGSVNIAISNSIAGNNKSSGITAVGGNAMTMSIDNTTIKGNSEGVVGVTPAIVVLSRSVIQGNGTGIDNGTSNTFYTYGNNLIDFNGTNITSPLNTTVTLR